MFSRRLPKLTEQLHHPVNLPIPANDLAEHQQDYNHNRQSDNGSHQWIINAHCVPSRFGSDGLNLIDTDRRQVTVADAHRGTHPRWAPRIAGAGTRAPLFRLRIARHHYPVLPSRRINIISLRQCHMQPGSKSFFTGCFYSQSPCPATRSYRQSSPINMANPWMHTRVACEPL